MPLTYFFNAANMPDGLYLLTLLKFGLIGLSSFVAFKNMYRSIQLAHYQLIQCLHPHEFHRQSVRNHHVA
jgi:uncharacterized membrane protein YfhO